MPVDRTRLPQVGPDPGFHPPGFVRHTLANGVQVRTIEHGAAPVIALVVQIQGGSSADPPAREGLAALTADLSDEGTGSLSALDVSDALARIGGEYDVEVGADATMFTLTTMARFAERGASLLAELLLRPSLREADFDRVRQLRRDRLRQIKDVPTAVADLMLLQLLYEAHPYGHLSIGSDRALRAVRLDETAAFHNVTFQPNRTTIVAAGPFEHGQLAAYVEGAFGGWESTRDAGGVAETEVPEPPPATARRLALVPRQGAQQSELRIGHLSARRDTPDYPALTVMNAVLGGQFVSRVNLKLREEKGYTYGATTGFAWRRRLAPFTLQASVDTAATADSIRDSLQELEAIRGSRPASDEELALGRASLTRGYARRFETAEQTARAVAQLALYDLPDSYFEEFVPRIQRVTADEVTRVARQYLDPERLTTLVVGDPDVVLSSMRGLSLGEPELLVFDT